MRRRAAGRAIGRADERARGRSGERASGRGTPSTAHWEWHRGAERRRHGGSRSTIPSVTDDPSLPSRAPAFSLQHHHALCETPSSRQRGGITTRLISRAANRHPVFVFSRDESRVKCQRRQLRTPTRKRYFIFYTISTNWKWKWPGARETNWAKGNSRKIGTCGQSPQVHGNQDGISFAVLPNMRQAGPPRPCVSLSCWRGSRAVTFTRPLVLLIRTAAGRHLSRALKHISDRANG